MDNTAKNMDELLEYEEAWLAAERGESGLARYEARHNCIKMYGFAVPTREALLAIQALGPVLEVGAGSGYWAYELRKLGADIIATEPDFLSDDPEALVRWRAKWTVMEKLSALDALVKYPERALFMCWPSYADDWSGEALEAYKGSRFALVSEGDYGCVGGDSLWTEIHANWEEERYVAIPQWDGIHDGLGIYRRK